MPLIINRPNPAAVKQLARTLAHRRSWWRRCLDGLLGFKPLERAAADKQLMHLHLLYRCHPHSRGGAVLDDVAVVRLYLARPSEFCGSVCV
jgi:hypothetical protein